MEWRFPLLPLFPWLFPLFTEFRRDDVEDVEFFLIDVELEFLGDPVGEFCCCRANSLRLVWGVRPAFVDMGELEPFLAPLRSPGDRPRLPLMLPERSPERSPADAAVALRKATREGERFVGDELILRGLEAIF